MRSMTALLSLLVSLTGVASAQTHHRNYDAHDYYAVHLKSGVRPEEVSSHLGLVYDGPLGYLPDHHMFRANERAQGHNHIKTQITDLKRLRRRDTSSEPHILDSILFQEKQELHKRFPLVKRSIPRQEALPVVTSQNGYEIAQSLGINDPIFKDQWHLYNPVQLGHDLNVTGVWSQGITGKNSTVCIVDDGLDMDSDDLRDNYEPKGSWDWNDQVADPKPRLDDDRHGTRCAGEVSAVRNNVCGVGVAYDSKIAGQRILSKVISDADEAMAMTWAPDINDVYSCSWGPPDDGQSMEQPGITIRRAMVVGVQQGRQGRGSIYVFAIGNGAHNDDNCNFDGYTNSIYSVSVGGIDRKGLHPYYSEACSAQLVVTYSSGSGDAIHTTDVGKDSCWPQHGGTSAAGPLVAGIYALMLQINPNLGWRDIQWITALTAVKLDQHSDWYRNKAIGKDFSHQFGYGKADAYAMVEAAKTWTNVKPQAWFNSPWQHVRHNIPEGDQGLASHFVVTADMLKSANFERIEHVTVTMNVEHTRRGDLSVELHSPTGMVSHIATHRKNDAAAQGYIDWTFMSVAHWGEDGVGDWTVIVKDTLVNEHNGTFVDWRLKLFGESIDASKQGLLPLPNAEDDDDHDREEANVATTSLVLPTQTAVPVEQPSDHIDRPVNAKPSATDEASADPTDTEDDKIEASPAISTASSAPATTSSLANFLPHPFPTFGVSKSTQVWIYGAFTLIVIFLVALGSYLYYMRRKRAWMSRDAYTFEMVEQDDRDGAGASYGNGGLGKGKQRRAGELYDAFAEGSDDDFGLAGDSEDEDEAEEHNRYKDREPLREGTDVK